MNQNKSNYITIKWIILLIISVGIGTFFMNVLYNTELNVWIARSIGCLVTVIVGLIFYYLWIKKTPKQ